jgi:hypothetical protein
MTSVLGTDAPDVDPLAARFPSDLGVDFIIDHAIAGLHVPPGAPLGNRSLRRQLASSKDVAGLLAAIEVQSKVAVHDDDRKREWVRIQQLLPSSAAPPALAAAADALAPWFTAAAELAMVPVRRAPPLAYGAGAPVGNLLDPAVFGCLALARQGLRQLLDPTAPVPLAAPLPPVPGRVTSGSGPIDVFEVGELTNPFSGLGHQAVRARLGALDGRVRWHWVHGPSFEHPQSAPSARIFEASLEQDPEGLWPRAGQLYKAAIALRNGQYARVLEGLGWPKKVAKALARAESREIKERVSREAWRLDACGVPSTRPAFVIGRRLFAGEQCYDELVAHVQQRLAAA